MRRAMGREFLADIASCVAIEESAVENRKVSSEDHFLRLRIEIKHGALEFLFHSYEKYHRRLK